MPLTEPPWIAFGNLGGPVVLGVQALELWVSHPQKSPNAGKRMEETLTADRKSVM